MHFHSQRTVIPAILFWAAVLTVGCTDQVQQEVLQLREQWLTQTAPTGEIPISEIRTQLTSGKLKPGSSVVVRAIISAGEMPPWTEGQAAFIITESTGHDGDSVHDPHQCPFCRRDVREKMAVLRFVGDDGKIVPVDARQLFGVTKGDQLVAEGTIVSSDAAELAIDARQLHLVR